MDDRKLNITLLAGGISAEKEVSRMTGEEIAKALRAAGHRVYVTDVGPDNLAGLDHNPVDLVFPALHGVFGEDGQIQSILAQRGLPYVGSGVAASKLAMDKAGTKARLLEHNVPTANWQVVYSHRLADGGGGWKPAAGIGYPCVIKPLTEGSSFGCKICRDAATARAHLAACLPKYGAMLVERFIDGYELTVGILDGETLPIIQIKTSEKVEFYDLDAKYYRDDTEYLFDIDLPARVLGEVSRVAALTHEHVGARHLSRVDVMVDRHTLEPFVLEINTLPGFTTHSLVPKAAAKAGIDFVSLCDRLARMALRDAKVGTRC